MKNLIKILSLAIFFIFIAYGIQAQKVDSTKTVTPLRGIQPTKKTTPVVNVLNNPINIEKDLAADKYFQEALTVFDKKKMLESAQKIREGAQELLKEAPKDDHNPQRKLVEQRIGELYSLSLRVEAGLVQDREVLQIDFANAEESLAHRYYEGTNTLIDGTPAAFADRLMGLSVHLRNSKEYHNPAEKTKTGAVADEAASLAAAIRKMKPGTQELTPALKTRLNQLMADVKDLKLDE
jgi:hypothetical protein